MSTPEPADQPIPYQQALSVMKAHESELLRKANVVGVGVGLRRRGSKYTKELALVVMVRKKVPADQLAPDDLIPAQIDGIPVDVQEVGDLEAQR